MTEHSDLSLSIPDALIEALATAVSKRLLPTLQTSGGCEPWPEWMAIETAARYLDVSPQRIRKLVANRHIPFHQEDRGCRILFRRTDLDEWMTRFRVNTRNEEPR